MTCSASPRTAGGLCQRLLQLGIRPTLRFTRRRLSHSFSRPSAWEKDTSSCPEGHQGGDAPLQLRGGGDGQGAALSHKRGALKDLPAHSQQQLAAGIRRQAGDGLLCAGIDGGKVPEGDAPQGPRRMVMSRPCHSSSSSPSIGAPDQG